MKHNHRRSFIAKNDKNRLYDRGPYGYCYPRSSTHRNTRFKRVSIYADMVIATNPVAHDASGPTLARSIYGAKHYVRSRIRFHEKARLKMMLHLYNWRKYE